jgi:3-deoxy-D-manno-octulosonate 8-phosphate phosphatase (KDO 8-P phosphatase)
MTQDAAPQEIRDRAAQIALAVFDVDGVLTDGKLYYAADGTETKAFHVQDGSALKLLRAHGVEVAIITGRQSPMVARRARELGIKMLVQNAGSKADALAGLLARHETLAALPLSRCCAVGDDLQDIELFGRVGLAISVPNGHPSAQRSAHWVTQTAGGQGVAREVAELILRSQNSWTYP